MLYFNNPIYDSYKNIQLFKKLTCTVYQIPLFSILGPTHNTNTILVHTKSQHYKNKIKCNFKLTVKNLKL